MCCMDPGFVGRGRELATLARRAEAALAGDGGTVLVVGEPGIGKTSVVQEATRLAGAPVLVGRAVVDDGAPAFWPWLRLLDHPAAAALALGTDLLDLGDDSGLTPAPATRFRAIDRAARALIAAAEPAGLILVLDDLQWADDASLQLLRYLCGELGGARLLVLGTVRSPDGGAGVPRLLTEITGAATVEVLRLAPLSRADVGAYLGGTAHPSWADEVHRHSGGNPLFVRELVRLLVQEDRLREPAGHLPVPAELRRLVGYRLGRLGERCHHLLGGCAAIGDEVDLTLLAAADPGPGPVAAPLAEAVDAGVLLEDPDTPNRLRFSHGLVRQAAYDSLSRADRLRWHHRIANALDPTGPTSERARHAVRAAVDAESCRLAITACRDASAAAARRLAFDDATHWQRQALSLLDGAGADDAERATTLLATAEAAYRAGLVNEALDRSTEVADLAERLDRADLLAAAAVVVRGVGGPPPHVMTSLCERARARLGTEDSARHARVLAQHALVLAEQADAAQAGELSARALAMAERSGDAAALIEAIHARQDTLGGPADVTARLDLSIRLRDLATAENRPDAALWAHVWRLDAAMQIGDVAMLDAELYDLAVLVDRLGWPIARWHLLRGEAARAMIAGDFTAAESLALAFREVGAQTQDEAIHALFYAFMSELLHRTGRYGEYEPGLSRTAAAVPIPVGVAHFGLYMLRRGDLDGAIHQNARLRPLIDVLPVDVRWLPTVAIAGALAAGVGDLATVEQCYRMLLPYERLYANATTGCAGSMAQLLARLAAALGNLDDADRFATLAGEQERRIGARADVALVQLAHAQVLAARNRPGDRGRASALAAEAARAARRLGMRPTADASATLVDELAGAPLTAREREIALLVADGLANRAIADRLVVSERTVETHVRNLLGKLGLANRTQVAGWAARAGYVADLSTSTESPEAPRS